MPLDHHRQFNMVIEEEESPKIIGVATEEVIEVAIEEVIELAIKEAI